MVVSNEVRVFRTCRNFLITILLVSSVDEMASFFNAIMRFETLSSWPSRISCSFSRSSVLSSRSMRA